MKLHVWTVPHVTVTRHRAPRPISRHHHARTPHRTCATRTEAHDVGAGTRKRYAKAAQSRLIGPSHDAGAIGHRRAVLRDQQRAHLQHGGKNTRAAGQVTQLAVVHAPARRDTHTVTTQQELMHSHPGPRQRGTRMTAWSNSYQPSPRVGQMEMICRSSSLPQQERPRHVRNAPHCYLLHATAARAPASQHLSVPPQST